MDPTGAAVDDGSLVLGAGDARLVVRPADGGRIGSLVVAGNELIVTEGFGPIRWGCYPMAPFAGRLGEGRLSFGGHTWQLPLNLPPHAIHGTVFERRWTVDAVSSATARLSVDLGPDWPFRGRIRQTFELERDRLRVALELAAEDPMPASIGWHPWFRRVLVGTPEAPRRPSGPVELAFDAERMYVRGPDGLPTGELTTPGPHPWDDCFTGLRSAPRLTWPGVLALEIHSTADHWVVYDEPEEAVCVEPQTAPPDFPRIAPHVVAPGAPLDATMTWRWWPLDGRAER